MARKAATFDEKQHVSITTSGGEVKWSGVVRSSPPSPTRCPATTSTACRSISSDAGYLPRGLTILPCPSEPLQEPLGPVARGQRRRPQHRRGGLLIEIFTDGEIQVTRWIRPAWRA